MTSVNSLFWSSNSISNTPKGTMPKVALLGDSISFLNNYYNGTEDLRNEAQGHLTWLNALSNQRYYFPISANGSGFTSANYGVSGERLDQMLSRVGDVVAYNPDVVIFHGGTNDITVTTRSYAQMISDARAIIETFTSRGIIVAVIPILPRSYWSSLSAGDITTRRKVQYNYNAWLRRYARTNTLCLIADPTRDFIDQSSATGDPITTRVKDGLHPSPEGGYYIGKALARVLNPLFPPAYPNRISSVLDVYDATDNPQGNLVVNGLMAGTAGTTGTGCSGVVASNWSVNRYGGTALTAVCSKSTITIDESVGQTAVAQKIVVSSTGTGVAEEYIRFQITSPSTITTGIAAGDRVYLEAVVKISGISGRFLGVVAELNVAKASGSEIVRDMDIHTSPSQMPAVTETITMRTPEWVLPSDLTNIRPLFYIYLDGNVAGGVTVDIAEVTIRKII